MPVISKPMSNDIGMSPNSLWLASQQKLPDFPKCLKAFQWDQGKEFITLVITLMLCKRALISWTFVTWEMVIGTKFLWKCPLDKILGRTGCKDYRVGTLQDLCLMTFGVLIHSLVQSLNIVFKCGVIVELLVIFLSLSFGVDDFFFDNFWCWWFDIL